jgi:hypothetical protein
VAAASHLGKGPGGTGDALAGYHRRIDALNECARALAKRAAILDPDKPDDEIAALVAKEAELTAAAAAAASTPASKRDSIPWRLRLRGRSQVEFAGYVGALDNRDALVQAREILVGSVRAMRLKADAWKNMVFHNAAVAVCRAVGFGGTVILPPVNFSEWKRNMRGTTTGAYMHLTAPGRAYLILAEKLRVYGITLVGPSEPYTSRTCCACMKVKPTGVSGRTFKCSECLYETHRDAGNAPINIFLRALCIGLEALTGLLNLSSIEDVFDWRQ